MKAALAMLALSLTGMTAGAQQSPIDSAFARASEHVSRGDSARARSVVDSIAASRGTAPMHRAEAAFRSAQWSATAADRERKLLALVVEHPLSPRLAQALYDLATLELARGDRDRGIAHLVRYLSAAAADDTLRAGAALTAGRLLVERGELPRACAMLQKAQADLPPAAIEIRNQFEFSIARCANVDTASVQAVDPRDTAQAPARRGAFTIQVAAYDTRGAADRLATTLRGQGLEARVVGTARPYRVRVGRFATRAAAEELIRKVDTLAKSQSMVVVAGPEDR